jgi:hypothetical protein
MAVVAIASADIQLGMGASAVQEIGGEGVYFPILGQAKISLFFVEARAIGGTHRTEWTSQGTCWDYTLLGGIAVPWDIFTISVGGGKWFPDENQESGSQYVAYAAFDYSVPGTPQHVTIFVAPTLTGESKPFQAAVFFSLEL